MLVQSGPHQFSHETINNFHSSIKPENQTIFCIRTWFFKNFSSFLTLKVDLKLETMRLFVFLALFKSTFIKSYWKTYYGLHQGLKPIYHTLHTIIPIKLRRFTYLVVFLNTFKFFFEKIYQKLLILN